MSDRDPQHEEFFEHYDVPSTFDGVKEPERAILDAIEENGYSEEAIFAIKLALEEALTNAVKHGNRSDPDKRVHVRFSVSQSKAVIIVRDDGEGFDPGGIPDPTEPDRLSLPSGRGIMLMRAYMTHVEYRRNGTELYLLKRNE
jgi:serine/threonine-protein kinase RsbW